MTRLNRLIPRLPIWLALGLLALVLGGCAPKFYGSQEAYLEGRKAEIQANSSSFGPAASIEGENAQWIIWEFQDGSKAYELITGTPSGVAVVEEPHRQPGYEGPSAEEIDPASQGAVRGLDPPVAPHIAVYILAAVAVLAILFLLYRRRANSSTPAAHRKWGQLFQKYGVLVAFLVLAVGAAFWRPDVFLQPEFIRNLLNQNAAVGILAIGMTLVIIGGGIDLSVGSMMALTASIAVIAMNKLIGNQVPELAAVSLAVAVCIGTGTLLGFINGLVITLGRVAPFIATLVGLAAFRSMSLALADGGEIRSTSADLFPELGSGGLPIPFLEITGGRPLVLTYPIIIFFVVALAAGFLLNWTRYGRHLIAVGSNEKAAIYSAISTNRVKVITYTLMGMFAGIAAIGLAARLNSVTTGQMGLYYELDAIAAVVIGGTSMSGGKGRIWTTVIGVLLLGLITNMLVISDVSVYWQGFVKGVIILLAVLIQRGQSD